MESKPCAPGTRIQPGGKTMKGKDLQRGRRGATERFCCQTDSAGVPRQARFVSGAFN